MSHPSVVQRAAPEVSHPSAVQRADLEVPQEGRRAVPEVSHPSVVQRAVPEVSHPSVVQRADLAQQRVVGPAVRPAVRRRPRKVVRKAVDLWAADRVVPHPWEVQRVGPTVRGEGRLLAVPTVRGVGRLRVARSVRHGAHRRGRQVRERGCSAVRAPGPVWWRWRRHRQPILPLREPARRRYVRGRPGGLRPPWRRCSPSCRCPHPPWLRHIPFYP